MAEPAEGAFFDLSDAFCGESELASDIVEVPWRAVDEAVPRRALSMAWRIHQVAYVENLKPRRQSNFSTALSSPMLPSWIESSS